MVLEQVVVQSYRNVQDFNTCQAFDIHSWLYANAFLERVYLGVLPIRACQPQSETWNCDEWPRMRFLTELLRGRCPPSILVSRMVVKQPWRTKELLSSCLTFSLRRRPEMTSTLELWQHKLDNVFETARVRDMG